MPDSSNCTIDTSMVQFEVGTECHEGSKAGTDPEINQGGGWLRFRLGLSYIVSITIAANFKGMAECLPSLAHSSCWLGGLGHPFIKILTMCPPEIESGSSFDSKL